MSRGVESRGLPGGLNLLARRLGLILVGLASSLHAQTGRYAAGNRYTFQVDSTCEIVLTGATQGATPQSVGQTQASRVQGTLRVTPVLSTGDSTLLVASMDPGVVVSSRSGTGAFQIQNVDTSLLQEPLVIEHRTDGKVGSVMFKALDSTTLQDVTKYNRAVSARNTLKGIVAMLDFRRVAPNSSLAITDGVDTTGYFNATFSRKGDAVIRVSKTSYSSLAPGMGLFMVRGDDYTPISEGRLNVASEGNVTLDSDGLVMSRDFRDEITVDSGNPAGPDAGGTFTPTAKAVVYGTLTRSAVEGTTQVLDLRPYVTTEDLTARVCCDVVKGAWRGNATVDAAVTEAIARIQNESSALGGMNLLIQAMNRGGDLAPVRRLVMNVTTPGSVAAALLTACGAAPKPAARALLTDFLYASQMPDAVTAQAVIAASAVPNPEATLISAVQHVAETRASNLSLLAYQSLGVLGKAVTPLRPAQAAQIQRTLLDRLERARLPQHRAALTRALGNLGDSSLRTYLAGLAEDPDEAVAESARGGLRKLDQGRALEAIDRERGEAQLAPRPVEAFKTKDNYCALLSNSLPYPTYNGQNFACEGRTESAGSRWLGGAVYAYYGAGMNGDRTIGDFQVGSGLDAYLLTVPIPFAEGKVKAHYDRNNPSNSSLTYSFGWLGADSEYSGSLDLSAEIPDDPSYPAYKAPFFNRGYSYRMCGQIWIFTVCFEAGVGAQSGVDICFGGFKNTRIGNQSSDGVDPTVFVKAGPYAEVNAYLEGSIGFFCLDLALRLEGDFLHTAFPIRMDLDPIGTDRSAANLYLSADQTIVPWTLRLYGRFDYCIGSSTKLLWEDHANPSTRPLFTHVMNPPDLEVTEVITSPKLDAVDTTTPIDAWVTIRNVGRGTTPPTRPVVGVVQAVGSSSTSSFQAMTISGAVPRRLRAGETFTGKARLTPPPAGSYTLKTEANPPSLGAAQIPEASYGNNVKTSPLTVQPAYPDLVIIKADVVTPTKVQGDTATVSVAVANVGPGPNPSTREFDPEIGKLIVTPTPVHVRVLAGTLLLGEQWVYTGGSAVTISFKTYQGGTWIKSIVVDVDAENVIREKDETNNTMANLSITTLDTAAPMIAISGGELYVDPEGTPEPLFTREKEFHRFTISASDDKALEWISYFVDGKLVKSQRSTSGVTILTDTFYFQTLAPEFLNGSSHTFMAKVTDKAGKSTSSPTLTFTVIHPDLVAPTGVARIVDLNGSLHLLATQLKDVAGPIQSGVASVQFLFDNVVVGTQTIPFLGTDANGGGVLKALRVNDATVAPGSHTLAIKLYDKEGNWAYGKPEVWYKDKTLLEVDANALYGFPANNTAATANRVYPYTRLIQGSMISGSDVDLFAVEVPAYGAFTFVPSFEGTGFRIGLVDAAGNVVSTSVSSTGSGRTFGNGGGNPITVYLKVWTTPVYDPDLHKSIPDLGPYTIELIR